MLAKRIIPCLDVKDGRVVKGKKFDLLKDVDDPVRLAKYYKEQGADELVFYDITASKEKRDISLDFVQQVALNLNIPFCVGGGVRTLADFEMILRKGADKISINSAAILNPNLIKEASIMYGSQCVVLSIDAKKEGDYWSVYMNGGRDKTHLDAISWAKQGVFLGAGEIVINSMDSDGMKSGYDTALLKALTKEVNVPVIASGGAGKLDDFKEAIEKGHADGVLAASVFHFKELTIREVKEYLLNSNIRIRL